MLVFNKKPFIIADISVAYYEFAKQEEIADIEAAKFLLNHYRLAEVKNKKSNGLIKLVKKRAEWLVFL